jgi:hypothetical protein
VPIPLRLILLGGLEDLPVGRRERRDHALDERLRPGGIPPGSVSHHATDCLDREHAGARAARAASHAVGHEQDRAALADLEADGADRPASPGVVCHVGAVDTLRQVGDE